MWNFENYKNNIAVIDSNDESLTYQEFRIEIDRYQKEIRDSRSLIFILTQNNKASLVAYCSSIQYGHVPLLINADINKELLSDLVERYQPNYLFMPRGIDINVASYERTSIDYVDYHLVRQSIFVKHTLHPDLSLLLSTSGSTGNPKLIRLSRANIKSNMMAIATYLNLSAEDRAITTLPMNYTYGLSIINSHLHVGASIVLTDASVVDKQFWQLFEEYRPTSLNGVPYTYQLLKRLLKPHHFSHLRYMTQAGGRLGSSLQEYFAKLTQEHNVDFYIMYGQTEATARMAYLDPSRVLDKLDSIGQAIPGGRFELVDDQGRVFTSPHTLGELVYYGPNVSMGYALTLEDLSLADQWQGRLSTGDLAIIDEEGFYFIQGRKNRYVKVYGIRVNLDDIEKELVRTVNTMDIAVTGIEDQIYVYTTEKMVSSAVSEVATKFNLHPSVFRAKEIPEIPKNSAGKILYSSLNESLKQ
jgi:long-chain acyl-CoA synthetase